MLRRRWFLFFFFSWRFLHFHIECDTLQSHLLVDSWRFDVRLDTAAKRRHFYVVVVVIHVVCCSRSRDELSQVKSSRRYWQDRGLNDLVYRSEPQNWMEFSVIQCDAAEEVKRGKTIETITVTMWRWPTRIEKLTLCKRQGTVKCQVETYWIAKKIRSYIIIWKFTEQYNHDLFDVTHVTF